MEIKVKKLDERAVMPFYATDGAAGFDFTALHGVFLGNKPGSNSQVVSTGLSFEIPVGYELEIRSRSGFPFNDVHISAFNGTIDSDFRGEVKILLYNLGDTAVVLDKGSRIAQGIIKKVEQFKFVEVDELSETARGENGFGHTGGN